MHSFNCNITFSFRVNVGRPVETEGARRAAAPPDFAKVELLPIDNNREKKKSIKKIYDIKFLEKLLITLLLSTSYNA